MSREWVELTQDDVLTLLADGYTTEVEFRKAVALIEAAQEILRKKNHDNRN